MTDEYIRKQDAVDAFNHAVQDVGILDVDDIETVFGMLSSADVVRVVRCKDCNYHSFDAESGRWWCNLTSGVRKVNHDDFCSEGKRKGT